MSKSFQSDENKTKNWLLNQFNIYYNGENILNISRKKIKELPPFFYTPNLQILNLYDNQITEIPKHLPQTLQKLYLSYNQITEIPEHLPQNLQILWLRNNQITKISEHLPQNLQILFLNNNQITEIPEHLPQNLQKLYLRNNQINQDNITQIQLLYPNLHIYI